MIEVWIGDQTPRQAQASGALKLVGAPIYLRDIESWLGLYLLRNVRPTTGVRNVGP